MSRIMQVYVLVLVTYLPVTVAGQKTRPDLLAADKWILTNRMAEPLMEGSHQGIHLNELPDDGLMILKGSDLADGTIELDIKGSNKFQQSFVGLAFHVTDPGTFDAIYFRPFNFKSSDSVRRTHAVQYVSMPGNDWEKLRSQSPGKYEHPITPAPGADDWFHAKVMIKGRHVAVYVNGNTKPSLEVDCLGNSTHGGLGLWVGNNSAGSFSNLTYSKNTASAGTK